MDAYSVTLIIFPSLLMQMDFVSISFMVVDFIPSSWPKLIMENNMGNPTT